MCIVSFQHTTDCVHHCALGYSNNIFTLWGRTELVTLVRGQCLNFRVSLVPPLLSSLHVSLYYYLASTCPFTVI